MRVARTFDATVELDISVWTHKLLRFIHRKDPQSLWNGNE